MICLCLMSFGAEPSLSIVFFFQAEDGIRDYKVTGVQTCALPISERLLKLLQPRYTGLPEGLAAREGLAEDALAEFGVSAQAIVSEARLLAQPVSFELTSTTQAGGV